MQLSFFSLVITFSMCLCLCVRVAPVSASVGIAVNVTISDSTDTQSVGGTITGAVAMATLSSLVKSPSSAFYSADKKYTRLIDSGQNLKVQYTCE
jgi:hypothetical protein